MRLTAPHLDQWDAAAAGVVKHGGSGQVRHPWLEPCEAGGQAAAFSTPGIGLSVLISAP